MKGTMVHNLNKVLDEQELKSINELKMKYEDLRVECWAKNQRLKTKSVWCDETGSMEVHELPNEEYEPYTPRIQYAMNKYEEYMQDWDWIQYPKGPNYKKLNERFINWATEDEIYKYLGKIPFLPCVMLNISPNWKGKFGQDPLVDEVMKDQFQIIVEKYLNAANRYSRWKYVLECGGEGNHLHCHIVAEINKGMYKSVMTHLNKGNHSVDLRKIWDKNMPKGAQGVLKGKFAIQRIILRTEQLRDDKLNYLIEEKKPEGHKNLEDLEILVGEF